MKATLADRVPRGDDWLFEIKWDGVRAVAFLDNEEVRLRRAAACAASASIPNWPCCRTSSRPSQP